MHQILLLLCTYVLVAIQPSHAALRGRPPVNRSSQPVSTLTIEQNNNLTSGAIFMYQRSFYLSISEWILITRISRVDGYLSHLTVTQHKLTELLDHSKINVTYGTQQEIRHLLDEISHLVAEISNFRLSAAHSTPEQAASVAAQSAGRRRRRRATKTKLLPQPCLPNVDVNLCQSNALFLPIWLPSKTSPLSMEMARFLKIFYRRLEARLKIDLFNNTASITDPMQLFPKRNNRTRSVSSRLPYLPDEPAHLLDALGWAPSSYSSTTLPSVEVNAFVQEVTLPPNGTYINPFLDSKPTTSSTTKPLYVNPYLRKRQPGTSRSDPALRIPVVLVRTEEESALGFGKRRPKPTQPDWSQSPVIAVPSLGAPLSGIPNNATDQRPADSTEHDGSVSPRVYQVNIVPERASHPFTLISTGTLDVPYPEEHQPKINRKKRFIKYVFPFIHLFDVAFPRLVEGAKTEVVDAANYVTNGLRDFLTDGDIKRAKDNLDEATHRLILERTKLLSVLPVESLRNYTNAYVTNNTLILTRDSNHTNSSFSGVNVTEIDEQARKYILERAAIIFQQLALTSEDPVPPYLAQIAQFDHKFPLRNFTGSFPSRRQRALSSTRAMELLQNYTKPDIDPDEIDATRNFTLRAAFIIMRRHKDARSLLASLIQVAVDKKRYEASKAKKRVLRILSTLATEDRDEALNWAEAFQPLFNRIDTETETLADALRRTHPAFKTLRKRRGLINFGGNIMRGLFGVLDNNDRERLDGHITELTGTVDGLKRVAQNQASVLNYTLAAVRSHSIILQNLAQSAALDFKNFYNETMEFSAQMRLLHGLVAQIRDEVRAFMTAWQFASTDQVLSSAFVEPSKLIKILEDLKKSLPDGLAFPLPVTPDNIHFYYGAIKCTPLLKDTYLTLLISIPLISTSSRYDLYRSYPFPHRFNNSDIQTFYQPETDYIAINEAQTAHLLLNEQDLTSCDRSELFICHPVVEVMTVPSCSSALFLSNSEQIIDHCQPRYIRKPKATFIGYHGGHSWLFSLPTSTRISLHDNTGRPKPTNIQKVPSNGILHLPINSVAYIGGAALYAGAVYQSQVETEADVIIPNIEDWVPSSLVVKEGDRGATIAAMKQMLSHTIGADTLAGVKLSDVNQVLAESQANPAWKYITSIEGQVSSTALSIVVLIIIILFCYCCGPSMIACCQVCRPSAKTARSAAEAITSMIPMSDIYREQAPMISGYVPRVHPTQPINYRRTPRAVSPDRLSRNPDF